ncbi:TetR/AcrR family transcriptional regulator [Mycolicibacterium sp. 018/SC-01/001]|uniref:TetR/AcrR family transcriptional regulator n=1 Tax=Mycolicibacterium sp. 018/SC-01/001 TaxID=2592069 RepID=UPI00117EF35E|nr:TetR/AcrR family transcriptional regulator [Mycolicibacterium sp. 018/SC-01/001]TRW79860.1 TetR/AcrR family transcriptional regulator [Mycolicibacterium sp. 018/SC-01/001]
MAETEAALDVDKPPARKRGRPVSAQARRAVLDAAVGLLDERGVGGFTVDEVARRSGVSKATIYKHWKNGFDLAAAAYSDIVTTAVPVKDTGDAVGDLGGQVRRLAHFYASPRGRVVAQLLGAAPSNDHGTATMRDIFFAERRAATVALIRRGQERGQLRPDLDPDLTVDLLFGPIIFRMFNGLGPLDGADARAVAEMGMRAIAALTHP